MRIIALLAAMCAMVPAAVAQAEAETARFVAGRHYQVLDPAQPTDVAPGNVEVVEIFWYGCPHCYQLAPHMQAWEKSKPDAAELVRLPATLNPGWHAHARLYFATRELGIEAQAHHEIFRELHVHRNPLNTMDSMLAFLQKLGVAAADARAALTSFDVEAEVRKADARIRRYRLSGVPAVVVNGRYVASVGSAGGHDALLELINHLVAKEAGTAAN